MMLNTDFRTLTIISALLLIHTSAAAQDFQSPEVHDDGRVTFRLRSSPAENVRVSIGSITLELKRGDNNVWQGTTSSLRPDIHEYHFNVDGTRMIDPSNRNVKKWFTLASLVEVPGKTPKLTELQDVPHGTVHHLVYPSSTVGHQRPVVVYTPPGYETATTDYPFLLLLHGFGDDQTAWTEVGRAHLIADNLIAQQKIRPCVIAMPYGHPVPPPYGPRHQRPKDYFTRNADVQNVDVVTHLLPFLQTRFRIATDRDDRAVAGLSMGGGHAIVIGLRNVDQFSSIGAFSAATPQAENEDLQKSLPSLFGTTPEANRLSDFWLPIGRDDFLLSRNRSFTSLLNEQNVTHDFDITEGNHSWRVWRRYLPEFLQRSFGTKRGKA